MARPLPVVDADSAPFWEALREGRLRLQRCGACERYVFYPRVVCPHCGGEDLTWRDVSGRATVHSYTVVHRPPEAFRDEAPYVVALVDLFEGPRLMTRIVGAPPRPVAIGAAVRLAPTPVADGVTLPYFTLDEEEI